MSSRSIPEYFSNVQRLSQERWKKLEDDPFLAAPWYQLFDQIKSPYHVISELLQNADDAGATKADVRVDGDDFYFLHNGDDFDQSSFSALCQFGYSNKRTLRTIGFRGLGFKSTFSLGKRVEVITPTLAIAFDDRRFTSPVWLDDAPATNDTIIHIKLEDALKRKFVEEEIRRWKASVAPMLFFRNIKLLNLNGDEVRKEDDGDGPVPGSQWIKLIAGDSFQRVLRVHSTELTFPRVAIDEITKERGVVDENPDLPPFSIEIIYGLQNPQRLYVVLPTKVNLSLPFSCNAPFVQDPARTGVKDPVLSPTNTWLLEQVGDLAARTIHDWLDNRALTISERATAYEFLPASSTDADILGSSDCTEHILSSFKNTMDVLPNILTSEGSLVQGSDCLASPREFNDIWEPDQILSYFGSGQSYVMASELDDGIRGKLQAWNWITPVSLQSIFSCLEKTPYLTMQRFEYLAKLWSFLYVSGKRLWPYAYQRYEQLAKLAIVPMKNSQTLGPAKTMLAPFGAKEKQFTQSEWDFLTRFFQIADETWIEHVFYAREEDSQNAIINNTWQLLEDLKLDKSVSKETIINQVVEKVFSLQKVDDNDGIVIARIAARSNVPVPPKMRFLCADGIWRDPEPIFLKGVDTAVEAILPAKWIETYSLSILYFTSADADLVPVITDWLRNILGSPRKLLRPKIKYVYIGSRKTLARESERLGGTPPTEYKYSSSNFSLATYQFHQELLDYWNSEVLEFPEFWAKVIELIAEDWGPHWEGLTTAKISQDGSKYAYPLLTGKLISEWIYDLRQRQCVLDGFSRPAYPSEVMCTTPETAALQGIERFIHPKLDKPDFRKFLELLGVRTSATDANRIVERLRVLSNLPGETTLREVIRLYEALERFALNGSAENVVNLKNIFRSEPLLVSQERTWHKADEIFQKNIEKIPGIPILHDGADFQTLWNRLGIAERPTFDSVIQWISTLPFGRKLNEIDARRVRNILQRYGIRVWEQCRGWLNLNDEWLPVDQIRWQTATLSSVNGGLFPFARKGTADLTMLDGPVTLSQDIPFLEQSLEYRLANVREIPNSAHQPNWLPALAQCVGRVEWDADGPSYELVNLSGRLMKTCLQPVDRLEVTPYLDNQPVADHQSLKVLWKDEYLYVVHNGSMLFYEIAESIAFHFPPQLKRAIQDCVERDPLWIEAYFERYFTLIPVTVDLVEPTIDPMTVEAGLGAPLTEEKDALNSAPLETVYSSENNTEDGSTVELKTLGTTEKDIAGTDESGTAEKTTAKERFQAFFVSRGFTASDQNGVLTNTKGDKLQKSKRVFGWEVLDRGGFLKLAYWVGHKSLQTGVEIPAEVWELFKKSPKARLLLPDSVGDLQEYNWQNIDDLLDKKQLELLQSSYRLRSREVD